ncbi:energy-coupling factor transporter transmembrane protein EcfT [Carnobacterium viridans]|uniref:Energy-coupling factor transport system permease protein n=1 Tax=Carnobacterium viridans TaxID=174587 RepID=A0A1H0ZQ28_9LACT|nr:energy-coupling factor transporter transmembrane component T [Carnobacterium viridans]UDE94520.1 energy-coupling factor transporter transmembrane protein EcfT [Carnobacterium viridans]SDQ29494.1 energy-coupling factor transport system permease protein [Carnobacterium viridans]
MMKVNENFLDKFTITTLKNQVLKNAYGNDETFVAALDPRTLFMWYVLFGIVPWFITNYWVLAGLFIFVAITTKLARTVPLILFVFCIGLLSETGFLFLFILLFGGDWTALIPVLQLTLKIGVVSLASITTFAGMDPDKLSNGLLSIGLPDQFAFSISYGYRILPIIMEEFQSVNLSYRLRGVQPDSTGFMGKIRFIMYQLKIVMRSFYPLMLNMAKRSRTTVEALEIKGYRNSMTDPRVKKMKLKTLNFTSKDLVFLASSVLYFALVVTAALIAPKLV